MNPLVAIDGNLTLSEGLTKGLAQWSHCAPRERERERERETRRMKKNQRMICIGEDAVSASGPCTGDWFVCLLMRSLLLLVDVAADDAKDGEKVTYITGVPCGCCCCCCCLS